MKKVEITHKTIFFTVFLIIGIWFLYFVRDILFQLLVSLVIVASFTPFVSKLEKKRVPRSLAVTISYLIFLVIIGFTVYILAPALVSQTGSFVTNIPEYINKIGLPTAFKDQILRQLLVSLGELPGQLAKTAASIFSDVLSVVTVLILSFYIQVSREKINKSIADFFGDEKSEKIIGTIREIEEKIGMWAKGELLLMIIVGTATYVGLTLLKVPYALPLGILAGLFEIVPMIGPFIAAIPAVVIAFSSSFVTGIATASLAFLIQQVENYVLVPKIMQKSAGVNPIITLIALSVGFRIQGVSGALIAIPIVVALYVLLKRYFKKQESPNQ